MIQKLRGFGSLLLGLVSLAIVFGAIGLCQWGYGQARPHVPDPVRSIVGGEKEFEVDDVVILAPKDQGNPSSSFYTFLWNENSITLATKI